MARSLIYLGKHVVQTQKICICVACIEALPKRREVDELNNEMHQENSFIRNC